MGIYLNPGNDEFYNAVINSKIYVDKTELLKFTNSVLCGEHKNINFIDITPRFLPIFAEKFSFEYLYNSCKILLFSNKLVTI